MTRRRLLEKSVATALGTSLVGPVRTSVIKPYHVAAAPAQVAVRRPFVFAIRLEPISLDPHANDFSYSLYAQLAAYEALVSYVVGENGTVSVGPALAEAWERSPDLRVYTFRLRRGVTFSDGTRFDAAAARFNFDRLFALNRGPAARIPRPASVEAVDEFTLRITLEHPSAPFLAALTQQPLMISPASAKRYEERSDWGLAWLNDHAVGTGPYLLQGWVRGQELTFIRNPGYWRGWRGPHAERIVLRLVREASVQRLMLETGDADLADNIVFEDLGPLSRTRGVIVQEAVSPNIAHVCLKSTGPLASRKVRQAVSFAFDYDALNKEVLSGRARQPLGPIPFGLWALDETLQPYRRDIERARRLMAEAGYPNGGFNVVIQTIAAFGWWQPRKAQILQQNLAGLGIHATIDDKADAATFLRAIWDKEKGPGIYFWSSRNMIDDPDFELRRMYHGDFTGPRGVNGMYYRNLLVDKFLNEALITGDIRARKALYARIQRILHDDAPALWAAQVNWYVTRRDAVQGFVWNPYSLGVPNYYQVWLSK